MVHELEGSLDSDWGNLLGIMCTQRQSIYKEVCVYERERESQTDYFFERFSVQSSESLQNVLPLG